MRRTLVVISLFVIVVGGCWAASNRSADDGPMDNADAFGELPDDVAIGTSTSGSPQLREPLPQADGDHFEAFDLLRNRPLAHRTTAAEQGASTWLDGAGLDFVRYVQGNHRRDWNLGASIDEEVTGAVIRGRNAKLTIPVTAPMDAEVMQMRVFNPAQWTNELTVEINGERVDALELESGWSTVSIDLRDVAVNAENDVGLDFSNLGRIEGTLSGGALAWARIGPGGADEGHNRPHDLTGHQGEMTLGAGQGLFWVSWIHDDALLELEIGAKPGCGPTIKVAVESGEGKVETILHEEIGVVAGRGEFQTTAINLPVSHSQVGRIELLHDADECESVELRRAALIRPGTIEGVPEDFKTPKYVVFWIIDTLRADYLPLHFETDVKAPNLKRLAAEGVSFETAYVQGTESRASHASLFTGKYPDRHRVLATGRVDPNLPILPHFFRDAGYTTGMLAANGYVSHLLNLDRGWDFYHNYIHEETALHAEFLVENGLEWIAGLEEEEPFFLYLGTIDPHATYRRHDDFIDLYEPADYRGRFRRHLSGEQLEKIKAGSKRPTEREKQRIINLYKNEITYNDYAFGKLRQALEDKGIWEDTLVVITADHGEEFWEHGSVGHGHNVHQEMVHVPLLFHYPRELPSGRIVRSGGEVIDIVPTIIDMLGEQPLEDRQGMSLLPTIYGEHGGYPAPALATQYRFQYGLQIRDWKLYLRSGSMRLYDRRTDPQEMTDIRADHPLASRWLQDSIGWFRAYRSEWDKSRWGVPNNVSEDFLELVSQANQE